MFISLLECEWKMNLRICQNVIIEKSPQSCGLLRRTSYVYVKNPFPHVFAINFPSFAIVQLFSSSCCTFYSLCLFMSLTPRAFILLENSQYNFPVYLLPLFFSLHKPFAYAWISMFRNIMHRHIFIYVANQYPRT